MMATAHRSTTSLSVSNNLQGFDMKQQRRMTLPSLPSSSSSLDLPASADIEHSRERRRPPSPLRNSHTPISEDGSDDDDDDQTWGRSLAPHSPNSSVTKLAATFAQRVGSFMSPARSPQMLPTEAELEAEAARERERSRKEAEKIIAMDRMKSEDRMTVEERVMAVLQNEKLGSSSPMPIPQRPQSATPTTPSPTASQKEKAGWWAVTRSKLTPTKEPLTPAQQVVQEAKARDKERQKEKRSVLKGKDKETEREWPAYSDNKYSDPAFLHLAMPPNTAPPRAISTSPSSSPTPARYSNPSSLNPSPLHATDGASSPSKANRPIYAQFNSEGVLDIPSTLLMIAKRFEKLEKWTVGHVRALEDRMDDVERWLVDKEKEKERHSGMANGVEDNLGTAQELTEMREELAEIQGRVGEIGREMAKLATSPGNLTSGPSRNSTSLARAPSTVSSVAVRSMTTSPPRIYPTSSPTKEPSPTIAPLVPVLSGTRTRLPYPTGDYATPPDSVVINQGQFSPTGSPPPSVSSSAGFPRPLSLSGLPTTVLDIPAYAVSGLPQSDSPNNSMESFSGRSPSATLPPPKVRDQRPSSISPTPRKRYTVALGGPIMSASRRLSSPPPDEPSSREASFGDEDNGDFQDETVGKAAGRRPDLSIFDKDFRRPRTQSTYEGLSVAVAPLQPKPRSRSRSTVGLGISDVKGESGRFIDPLVLRRREKEGSLPPTQKMLPNKGKKAVGDLVAFFDGGDK